MLGRSESFEVEGEEMENILDPMGDIPSDEAIAWLRSLPNAPEGIDPEVYQQIKNGEISLNAE